MTAPERRPDLIERLGLLLETRAAKILLSGLIVLSVLPYPELETTLRPVFLLAFGIELLVRMSVFVRGRREQARIEPLFLFIDFIALCSFLPLVEEEVSPEQTVAVRLLRLVRLLVLLRYTRSLARDVWSVLTRREQVQQFGLVTAAVVALAFVAAVVLHQVVEILEPDEANQEVAGGFWDRMWWAFRQIESPDNLIKTLEPHPIIIVISLGLTVIGVFIVAYLIGIGTNVVDQVVKAERLRPVSYQAHTLVVGGVHHSELLVREFVRLFEKNRLRRLVAIREAWDWLAHGAPPPRRHALLRMALLAEPPEPPPYLYDASMRWVVYRQGEGSDPEGLARVAAASAKRALFLADRVGPDSDAITMSALGAFRGVNPAAHVYVEVLDHDNEELIEAVGGEGTFPLNSPRFLGLFLCHHLILPGAELLFRELLTVHGAEVYTHLFVDPAEHRMLSRLDGQTLRFEEMARGAAAHGVSLIGVYLAGSPLSRTAHDLIPIDRLQQWLNPEVLSEDDDALRALGARPGQVPVHRMAGVIGVAPSYLPLKRYARALLGGKGIEEAPSVGRLEQAAADRIVSSIRIEERPIRRVLVVGYSPALGSLLAALGRFVPDVEVIVALSARTDATTSLSGRLADLHLGLERDRPPGRGGRTVRIERGGRVTVYTHEGEDITAFVAQVVKSPVDAAVFLSDPESVDPDARTAMRVLRFSNYLKDGTIPRSPRLHLLIEVLALFRGEQLRRQVRGHGCGLAPDSLDVTIVSTEAIRNYFLVHSAFVPGATDIYDRLLGVRGMEIVRLPVPPDLEERSPISIASLREALLPRQAVPFALALSDGQLITTPPPGERFTVDRLRGIYAISDTDTLATRFGRELT